MAERADGFPFLLGGAFIEAANVRATRCGSSTFPFLLGGAFIEALSVELLPVRSRVISLPSWRGFH